MSLTLGLNTALSGLLTSQRGLDVISQNVVNVNTVGYTRKVMTPESRVLDGKGAGVQEGNVIRQVSEGLLKDIRKQTSTLNQLATEQSYYPRIDDLFGEVDDNSSIAHKVNDLFTSFQTLGTEVNKPATQWSTMQSGQDVSDLLGNMTSQLQSLRIEADRDMETSVDTINNILENIHDLNQKIVKNGAVATGTTDLEDKRDTELTELSKYIDIQYFKRGDGGVTVYSSSGQMLLDNQPQELTYSAGTTIDAWMTAAAGQFNAITVAGGTQDLGPEIKGGKMRALLDLRDTIIPNMQATLDQLASSMKSAVNLAHNRGTSLPNASSRYDGTRTFATQGDVVPGTTSNIDMYWGTNSVDESGLGGSVTWGTVVDSYEKTMTSASGAWPASLTPTASNPKPAFSVDDTDNPRNSGTYRVVGIVGGVMTVEKVNVRQTMQLQGTEDVAIATFDTKGDQLQQTTLNDIMQIDFTVPPYSIATAGTGRSLDDFLRKGDHGDWSINEVSAHVEAWLKSAPQSYANASVNLSSEGKLIVDVGNPAVSLVFRDQVNSTAGSAATDATIAFDINGDGATDETVKGFANFFGLNDFFVNDSENSIFDSTIQPETFATGVARDLTLYDGSGKVGNSISLPRNSSLEDIAKAINRQTRTNESAELTSTSWDLTTAATITVSDGSGQLETVNVAAGTTLTLNQLAGLLTQGTVTASVIQDGGATRLRLVDGRGNPLTVDINGGAVSGSSLDLNQTLDMTQKARFSAAVVPEGSGYRLRIKQTENDEMYASSTLVQGANLLSDLGLERAATATATDLNVRGDIQTGPEKISRGAMQWNSDTGSYYLSEGDNTTALAISAALKDKNDMDSAGGISAGKYSFAEYAAASISIVVGDAGHSKDRLEYQTTLNQSLDFQNTSLSGVNLDEEVSSMIDFQQAYAASAKVISVLQEMLQTLTDIVH